MNFKAVIVMMISGLMVVLSFQNCSENQFSTASGWSKTGGLNENGDVIICDPFLNPDQECLGNIMGDVYYLNKSQQQQYLSGNVGVGTYFMHGKRLKISVLLPQLFIPTMPFNKGFRTSADPQNPTYIVDDDGDKLIEYFAMRLKTDLALSPGQSQKKYLLAVLSDDGAIVTDRGAKQVLIDNDGDHATRLGCANTPIILSAGKKLPLTIEYFQGPRHHISLTLLWKEVSGAEGADPLCGQEGNDKFFGPKYDDFSANYGYGQLLSRGWKVIPSENFHSYVSNQ